MNVGLLVIDSGSKLADALVKYFDYEGFMAYSARDAKEALTTLKACTYLPQAILIDLDAACKSEFSLLDALKTTPEWHHIPVLVVVRKHGPCDLDRLSHARHVFEKPVAMPDLVAVLSQYCCRRSA